MLCVLGCWWSTRQPFTVMLYNNVQRCDRKIGFANSTACCALGDVGKGRGREKSQMLSHCVCIHRRGCEVLGRCLVWCMYMCLTEARGRASEEERGPCEAGCRVANPPCVWPLSWAERESGLGWVAGAGCSHQPPPLGREVLVCVWTQEETETAVAWDSIPASRLSASKQIGSNQV